MRRSLSFLVAVSLAALPTSARADFELPILFPVPKIVVVSEDASEALLSQLATVRELVLEVKMSGGNMLRDVTVDRFNRLTPGVTKRVELQGSVRPIHVGQLRRLDEFEVTYRVGPTGLDEKALNALYSLGPVRKYIILPDGYSLEWMHLIGRLKVFVPVFPANRQSLDPACVDWLLGRKLRGIGFVLPADLEPGLIYDRVQFSPVELVVQTSHNRIPAGLMNVLKDLRGVEVIIEVDGRLTLNDVKSLLGLERFSLRVDLGQPPQYTPGLPALLNRIAPPLQNGKNRPNH